MKSKTYGPYDLIHGHGDNCFFSSLFREKTPFLMTFHGTMAKILDDVSDPRLKPVLYPERVAVNRCDVAVACSRAVKNELTYYYGTSAGKIKVIYNGIDVKKFAPMDKKAARRKLGMPESGKYALWVGSNPTRKRLKTAVKAVEKSKCSKLLVVGMTGENMRKTVFLGKLPEAALIAAYSAADVLIFPTAYEGFPIVPLEALSCGLPVIASEESNIGEIIEESKHGFIVKDGNPNCYQRKIDQIINDDSALNQISINCRELALDYSWQKQANKYWLIYRSLLRNR